MSPGWRCARASSFISLRETPKSQRLNLVAYSICKKSAFELFAFYFLCAVCNWVVSRSEIKEERQPKASAEDIRGGEQPKRRRLAQILAFKLLISR
jgi:hypothetical protein